MFILHIVGSVIFSVIFIISDDQHTVLLRVCMNSVSFHIPTYICSWMGIEIIQ